MRQVADLHIHSRYSRACSSQLELEGIDAACRMKGVDIVATGDFTHPVWFKSLRDKLEETAPGKGLYRLKAAPDDRVKFILSTEISLIYKQGDKARRIHVVVQAPNLEAVRELDDCLGRSYNIKSDGWPILGMKAPDLVRLCRKIDQGFLVYPAHIWTPWFSVFGSKSGFDTMEECFGDQTEFIYAIETGLSSDPAMNWRVSALDRFAVLSNSDAHSPANIAREANVLELDEPSYEEIREAISAKGSGKLKATIEFYPEEGMYHLDGHRACDVRLDPEGSRKRRGLCPACGKPLTIGVMNRVEELADRPDGFEPPEAVPFRKLVGLDKIIAEALGIRSRTSKKVQAEYDRLIRNLGPELDVLLEAGLDQLADLASPLIAEGIKRVRAGELMIEPGYDGVYGTVKIFRPEEREKTGQSGLFEGYT